MMNITMYMMSCSRRP